MDLTSLLTKLFPDRDIIFFRTHPTALIAYIGMLLVIFLVIVGLVILAVAILSKINDAIFAKLERRNGKTLVYEFTRRLIDILIVIVVVIIPLAGKNFRQSILGSTAVLAAILGFAGKDVIKDMLSGLLISIYKPFDLGDRIEMEDGTIGVVESITLRHIVIIRIDTQRVIVPNSKANSMSVINYSYGDTPKSVILEFPVAYTSDIEKAKKVISDAVSSSPLTRGKSIAKDGTHIYAPVYFLRLTDNAIIMSVTVYCDSATNSIVLRDDIHTRVFNALRENNIEIPYNYVNLIQKNPS